MGIVFSVRKIWSQLTVVNLVGRCLILQEQTIFNKCKVRSNDCCCGTTGTTGTTYWPC